MLPPSSEDDGSEDYTHEDILIRRGTRPKRRRQSSPVNLRPHRDLMLRNPSSTEFADNASASNIHRADLAGSSAANRFDCSHSPVFDSKIKEVFPSIVNQEISNVNDTSFLTITGSNLRPTSLVDSQDASQRIIKVRLNGSEDRGRTRTSRHPSTRPSQTSRTSAARQTVRRTQTSHQSSVSIPLKSHPRETEKSKKRKKHLREIESKLKQTTSTSRDWSTMSEWQKQQLVAVAAKANASADNLPQSSRNLQSIASFNTSLASRDSSRQINRNQQSIASFNTSLASRDSSRQIRYSSMIPKGSHISVSGPFMGKRTNQTSSKQTTRQTTQVAAQSRPARLLSCLSNFFCRVVDKLTKGRHEDVEDEIIDISSDEEVDNWSVFDDRRQLDSEWLHLSDGEVHDQIDPKLYRASQSELIVGKQRNSSVWSISSRNSRSHKRSSVSAYHNHTYYPVKFLYVMLPVYKSLLYLGRFPFEIDTSEDIPVYKLNRKSWRYFVFIGTSLLALLASLLMVANLIAISTPLYPLTFHESILRLEKEKYWIEGTLEILNMIFVAVFSISMMEYGGGVFLVDFLNRWSQSVSIIRYDVTPGLRSMVYIFFTFYGIYAMVIIILFLAGGEKVPTVRGMCGFTGILILKSFTSELRLRPGFHAVEYFGLFIHLYTTLAGSLTILLISMQCWALENAAERFNHRLASCLHGAGFRNPASVPRASRIMPYSKLFAEHLVVTSFPGYIGETFCLGFAVYLGCKMVEMVITLFGLAEPLVNGFRESNETFFDVSAQTHFDPELVVPIMIVEPANIYSIKSVIYVAKTWLPWFIFMEIVQRPGTTIIRGANLIVRNFYIQCKTTHALRFIASMEFSFSNRAAFFVNPGVQVTRSFVGKFVGYTMMILLTLLQFIPSEVNIQTTIICDRLGGCFLFQFPAKSRSHGGYQDTVGKIISDELHRKQNPLLPPPDYEMDFQFRFPPCLSGGLLPMDQSSTFSFKCSRADDSVYIPTYFKKSSNKFIQIPPTPDHSCVKSSELPLNEILFDCYGHELKVFETDECGNPNLPTPDFQGNRKLPHLQVTKFVNSEIFCCYVYDGLESQADRCNLMSIEAGTHNCSKKSTTEDRRQHEKLISALWDTSDESFGRNRRDLWTQCLCQGLDGIPNSITICAASELPASETSSSSPNPDKPSSSPNPDKPCPEYNPIITNPCKKCEADARKIFGESFLHKCSVEGSPNQFFMLPTTKKPVTDSNGLIKPIPWRYPCEKQTTILDRTAEEGDYYDCFGSRVSMQNHEYKDDCGTKLLYFPDRFNGKLSTPRIKVVRLDPGIGFRFVCCWNYEEWQDSSVNSKCNLYPGSDLTKVCCLRSAITDVDASIACKFKMLEDSINNKLYLKKCVNPDGKKTLTTCRN